MHLPKAVHPSIVSRFKVLAKMDIAERRAPQDGAIRVKIEQREVDLRVSSLPILHGEKMVLRVTEDRKSTRLNSSHLVISYAVFCLKKKKKQHNIINSLTC